MCSSSSSVRLPSATVWPSTVPMTPLPVIERKSCASESVMPPLVRPATMAAASGCSLPRSRLAARRSSSVSSCPGSGDDGGEAGLALGERAGLVDHERVDLLQHLERLGVLDQDAGRGAAAGADHDRHRRGEPEGAGAGDDEDRDGVDQGVGEARLRPEEAPDDEGEDGDHDDRRDEVGRDDVGQALDRGAGALGLADHAHDLGQQRLAADALGPHDEAAGAVDRPADDAAAWRLLDRNRLAGDHRLVDGARAFEDHAVDGHLLTGADAEPVARLDVIERNIFFSRRRPGAAGRSWGRGRGGALMALLVWLRARSSSTWPRSTSVVITAAASK